MAKKSRRARQRPVSVVEPVRIKSPGRSPSIQAAPKEIDFATEYHYVVEDLKRIAIIAGLLMVMLITAAIVIG